MRNVNMIYMMRTNWKGMSLGWDDFLQHITWKIGSGRMADFGIVCGVCNLIPLGFGSVLLLKVSGSILSDVNWGGLI